MNIDNTTLIQRIKNSWKPKLLCCPHDSCGAGLINYGTEVTLDSADNYLVVCLCSKCKKVWYLCRHCDKGKRNNAMHHLMSREAAHNHMYRIHKELFCNESFSRKKRKVACKPETSSICNSTDHSKENSCFSESEKNDMINNIFKSGDSSDEAFDVESNEENSNADESLDTSEDEELPADLPMFYNDDYEDDYSFPKETHCETTPSCSEKKSLPIRNNFMYENFKNKADTFEFQVENYILHNYSDKMATFFNHHCKNDSGMKYLVSKSFTRSEQIVEDLSPEEVQLQMLMTQFIRNLTRAQLKDFSEVLKAFNNLYINPDNAQKIKILCEIPTDFKDIRRHYTDGVFSIAMNSPTPESIMLKKHSYVSIKECIAHFLLDGRVSLKPTNSLEKNEINNIFSTKMCERITKHALDRYESVINDVPTLPLVTVFIYLWSDDFEPNATKTNRHSVWAKTMTLFVANKYGNPKFCTYPIAFGPKGRDHEEVESNILGDIISLREGKFIVMYATSLKTLVCVHADIFAILNDQPERRSSLKLSAGNSQFHIRFSHSCPLINLKDKILPCKTCQHNNVRQLDFFLGDKKNIAEDWRQWRSTECSHCTNWLMFHRSKLLYFPASSDFPSEKTDESNYLKYHELTFTKLKETVHYVHEQVITNNLPKKTAVALLKYFCINNISIEMIYEHARNCRLMKEAERNKEEDPQIYNDLLLDKLDRPEKYTMWKIPSNWKLFETLERYVEVPMHLYFLNIQKMLIMDMHRWLKCQRKYANYKSKTSGLLEPIIRLQLSWCKLLPYPRKKAPGWVSENWMSLCRVLMWVSQVLVALPPSEDYSDPSTNPSNWTRKQNIAWLRARGLKIGNLNAQDLKNVVLEYYRNNQVPDIIQAEGCSVETVIEMLKNWHTIVSISMTMKGVPSDVMIMESAVRVFLTNYAIFSDSIKKKTDDPLYFSRYSVMSLLNLSRQTAKYGSMRNVWEGGEQGEGFLRRAKTEIKRGLNRNWPKWLLDNLLLDQSCAALTSPLKMQHSKEETLKEVKIFNSKVAVISLINSGKPFSGMCELKTQEGIKESTHYILYHDGKNIVRRIQLELLITNTIINTVEYFIIREVLDSDEPFLEFEVPKNSDKHLSGVLFLPKLVNGEYPVKNSEDDVFEYCAIYSCWLIKK